MLDGVLHQRDQHGGRHRLAGERLRQFKRKRQAITHPRLHDGEECRRHFKFTPERGGLGAQPGQARPQEGDQLPCQRCRLRRLALGKVLHRAQRIEQKVWLHLRLHQLQSCVGQLPRRAVGFGLPLQRRVSGLQQTPPHLHHHENQQSIDRADDQAGDEHAAADTAQTIKHTVQRAATGQAADHPAHQRPGNAEPYYLQHHPRVEAKLVVAEPHRQQREPGRCKQQKRQHQRLDPAGVIHTEAERCRRRHPDRERRSQHAPLVASHAGVKRQHLFAQFGRERCQFARFERGVPLPDGGER